MRSTTQSNMTLEVQFLAGTSIEQAIEEAAYKCRFLDLAYVVFTFNGVNVSVKANTDVKWGAEQFMRALEYKQTSVVL